jgi:hypothetical protein
MAERTSRAEHLDFALRGHFGPLAQDVGFTSTEKP